MYTGQNAADAISTSGDVAAMGSQENIAVMAR